MTMRGHSTLWHTSLVCPLSRSRLRGTVVVPRRASRPWFSPWHLEGHAPATASPFFWPVTWCRVAGRRSVEGHACRTERTTLLEHADHIFRRNTPCRRG
jgi:hypothetical protein